MSNDSAPNTRNPRMLLGAIRRELRDSILPKLTGEFDRSLVISMIGIVGEIAPSVVEDDSWTAPSNRELREGCDLWSVWLKPHPVAQQIEALSAASHATATPAEAHRMLLEAAELAMQCLWQNEDLRQSSPLALEDLRARLASDLARDLKRTGRR